MGRTQPPRHVSHCSADLHELGGFIWCGIGLCHHRNVLRWPSASCPDRGLTGVNRSRYASWRAPAQRAGAFSRGRILETVTLILILLVALLASSFLLRMSALPVPLPLAQIAVGAAIGTMADRNSPSRPRPSTDRAPPGPCEPAGAFLSVPYSADYVFLKRRRLA